MPARLRPASIRGRLLMLVLALWLPAVIGLGLQARNAYLNQAQASRDELQQQALALRFALDAELDRRLSLARALASLPSLRARDFDAFDRDARLAVRHSDDAVMLVDRERQYVYTALPSRTVVPRRAGSLFVETGMGISFVAEGPVSGKPAIAVLVPEAGATSTDYNVGVPFPTAQVQSIIGRQVLRESTTASVIDAQQRVMGRSRNPERWVGSRASHPALIELAQRGDGGFVNTTNLDGVASLTYLSAPGRHGWATVMAMPEATLKLAARQLAWQAVAVSTLLLGIALGLALIAARLISRPVRSLERAAGELLAQRVPGLLNTGVAEIDRVGAVLHDAGTQSRQWEQVLEARVQRAIEDTRQAEARLFEARKHEAIGRLSGGVAHDFNNLLQTISMGLEMTHRALPEGRHTRPLQAALAACGRAAQLVRQMLAFGRAQQLRPQPVKLADLLLRSRELTDKALGERIELIADVDPGLPPVIADPVQLELALLNLVFNARDAMPAGGRVTLTARAAEGPAFGFDAGPIARIDVQDTGHGMDGETLSRVFEPYFTTKPVGAGSGLGLPQVQAFARQSGGDVRITSAPGTGTCVTLLLPVSQTASEEPLDATPIAAAAPRPRRPLRILMAEDDVLVASVVGAALEHQGHHVTLCHTADECRERLEQGIEADVLFTDIVMPGAMTGLELVEWCRQARPFLPTLVATGYSANTPTDVGKLLRKPYTIDELLNALEVCVAGTSGR